jgi:hypothetical protein
MFGCTVYHNGTNKLTPVENYLEYQNDFFPIEIGKEMNYNVYRLENDKMVLSNTEVSVVTEYKEKKIKLGGRLMNVPIFRLKYFEYEGALLKSESEVYLLKTKEGIAFTSLISEKKNLIFNEFIPSSEEFDGLRNLMLNIDMVNNISELEWKGHDLLIIKDKIYIHSSLVYRERFYRRNVGLVREIRTLEEILIYDMIYEPEDTKVY